MSLNTVASRYRYALQKLKDWVPEELEKPNPNFSQYMNEFDSIEKELKALTPKSPSSHLTAKVEVRLGDAGNLAMRRLPEEIKNLLKNRKVTSLWFPLEWVLPLPSF